MSIAVNALKGLHLQKKTQNNRIQYQEERF